MSKKVSIIETLDVIVLPVEHKSANLINTGTFIGAQHQVQKVARALKNAILYCAKIDGGQNESMN